MKRFMKYTAMAAFVAVFVMAGQAAAETVSRESSCTAAAGSNRMTYDCNFNVREYQVGTPITFTVNYACTSGCGPVLSFGLGKPGFTPPGVSGRLVGGRRLENGVELTFVFDALKSGGNAHFTMNVNMDDGSGNWESVPAKVKVHLNE
jgi:hypothetical protein